MTDLINSKEYHKAFKKGVTEFQKHMRTQGFKIKLQKVGFQTQSKNLECPQDSHPETIWDDQLQKWITRCSAPVGKNII